MAAAASTSTHALSQGEASLDVLPAELQNTIMEGKFAQIKKQRQEARTVLREAKQRTRNQQTDQQILLLMQTDERLAALLSQAADSMRALLPVNQTALASYTDDAGGPTTTASSSSTSAASHGAKAFEEKAQQWFLILNEVQYSLRSAVRFLREAQLAPLALPAAPEARSSGRAGSASRGHNLSLLEAFVDLGSLEGTTFKLPPADGVAPKSALSSLPEAGLSLQALRERHRNWKALSSSLQQVKQSMAEGRASPELSLLESIRNGCSSDRILLDALVSSNSVAQ
ncbi:conserved hypothetical protein [Sporisorium reilianum SRZ2]|uniref:Mediator of RNA polymerase II transcription subunit 11 n=1 Tax=Sporisorium reilianum (strain SRZ2) TaxID=999809 RepID=E6ZZ00_SPORE|nr:conserved hypothetical protein [Sporisorium reilianum SRZ2]